MNVILWKFPGKNFITLLVIMHIFLFGCVQRGRISRTIFPQPPPRGSRIYEFHNDELCCEYGYIHLRNRGLEVRISTVTGAVVSVKNRIDGINLLERSRGVPPLKMETADGTVVDYFYFDYQCIDARTVKVAYYNVRMGVELRARIRLFEDDWTSGALIFDDITIYSRRGEGVRRVVYPVLGPVDSPGIQLYRDSRGCRRDRLAHPVSMGFLFKDPLNLFIPGDELLCGVKDAWYPSGFHGSPVQTAAYYAETKEPRRSRGFWFLTPDDSFTVKSIDAFINERNDFQFQVQHLMWDYEMRETELGYPVVVSNLEGDWWTAVDLYRSWALEQEWASGGPLFERARQGTADEEFLESTGYAVCGLSVAADRDPRLHPSLLEYEPSPGLMLPWFQAFDALSGNSVLFISGYRWSARSFEPDFRTFADEDLIREVQDDGNILAGWFFDRIVHGRHERSVKTVQSEKVKDRICPLAEDASTRHLNGDLKALRNNFASIYYDIGPCVGIETLGCENADHGHPPGFGRHFVEAMRRQYEETLETAAEYGWNNLPLGQELMAEPYLREFSYYRARSYVLPCPGQEGARYRKWVENGQAEVIPYFDAVYHDWGPVRIDGAEKLSEESGDLFYWTAARTVLNGGMAALDYTTVPPELFNDRPGYDEYAWESNLNVSYGESFLSPFYRKRPLEGSEPGAKPPVDEPISKSEKAARLSPKERPGIISAQRTPAGYRRRSIEKKLTPPKSRRLRPAEKNDYYTSVAFLVDPEKQKFLRKLAEMRTGFGKRWLVYGRLVRPLRIETDAIGPMNWRFMNYSVGYDAESCSPPELKNCDPPVIGGRCFWCMEPRQGSFKYAESVVHSAFLSADDKMESLGLFFVNLKKPERYGGRNDNNAGPITITVVPADYGMKGELFSAFLVSVAGERKIRQFRDFAELQIMLPPREPVMIEIRPG